MDGTSLGLLALLCPGILFVIVLLVVFLSRHKIEQAEDEQYQGYLNTQRANRNVRHEQQYNWAQNQREIRERNSNPVQYTPRSRRERNNGR